VSLTELERGTGQMGCSTCADSRGLGRGRALLNIMNGARPFDNDRRQTEHNCGSSNQTNTAPA